MSKTILNIKNFFLFWLFVISMISCTDPQVIGLEIQPEGEKITIFSTSDNAPFTSATKKVDSVRSSQTAYALLGHYDSDDLLDAKASFSTHLRLSDNAVDFGINPVLDSAIITLAYAGFYGDTSIEMNIQVEQLSDEIFDTTMYFSDDVFSTVQFSNPLQHTFLPRPNTIRFRDADTVGLKSLSFNANQIGQAIIDINSENLVDNDVFVPFFKGLQFSVSNSQPSSSILYFNLIDGGSKLTIYYNDSLSYDLLFSAAAARVNHFEMQADLDLNNILAVQSMAGLEVHLEFNNLQYLKETLSEKVINQAIISLTEQNISDLPHSRLSLVRMDTNETRYFLEDVLEGQSHFGGELNDNIYNFNITKFLQKLVHNNYESNTLIIVPTGESVNANRTKIYQNLELSIIYTEF